MQIDLDTLADAIAERIRVPQRDRLIGLAQLADLLGCSKTTASRIAGKAGFPKRISLPTDEGRGSPRWRYGEVMAWLDDRKRQ